MMPANVDVAYNEYIEKMNDDKFIESSLDGEIYKYDFEDSKDKIENSDCIYNLFQVEQNIISKLMVDWKNPEVPDYFNNYFEQRPDVKLLYDEYVTLFKEVKLEYKQLLIPYDIIKTCYETSNMELYKEKYEILSKSKEDLENQIQNLTEKLNVIFNNANDYMETIVKLRELKNQINYFEKKYRHYIADETLLEQKIENKSSISDVAYYSKLKQEIINYKMLLIEKDAYQEKLSNHICSAITMDDVSDKYNGYDSTIGIVPAGEWDTHKNSNYSGYGYETGMLGSFEGPQGKETGYDSRKGATKSNYKDPDRALLKLLSEVTDKEGNLLYPMSSFEKDGEYYYHIFGVNDDGSIDWSKSDNPRFGCKMLGNYLIVGCDQKFNRSRGSKLITSLGPAIVFDYGEIEDLEADPSHIDISMDEVLFWLRDFSHNEGRYVVSMAGIYDWCTTSDYRGTVDFHYEHMERNYVNNLNVMYGSNLVCFFDNDDFEDETTFASQEDFVKELTYSR